MRNAISAVACLLMSLLSFSPVTRAETLTPPAASANVLKGIQLSGEPVAADFKAAFARCDAIPHPLNQPQCWGAHKNRNIPGSDPNANHVLFKLPSGAIVFDAKLGVDADGSDYAKTHIHKNSSDPNTSLRYADGSSLNADKVRYVVIPGGFDSQTAGTGLHVGDVAAIVYRDKLAFAIIGDTGKPFRIGEGSMALHEALGHRGCDNRDASGVCTEPHDISIENNVVFIMFPHTREQLCGGVSNAGARLCLGVTPSNINELVDKVGKDAFDKLKQAQ